MMKKKISGLKLKGLANNQTIETQKNRGQGAKLPYSRKAFRDKNKISLDLTYLFDDPGPGGISRADLENIIPQAIKAHQMLKAGEGDCRDNGVVMLGWQNLPDQISKTQLKKIKEAAKRLSDKIDAFVSLGIGGSYLGIEATIKALTHTYNNQLTRRERGGAPEIYFLGQNMDADYFRDTLDMLRGKRVGINVISKSGTTTETAIAFRIFCKLLEENYGIQSKDIIYVTTDKARGALRKLSAEKGYSSFVVPDDVGGRFSVLTDVGLVGIAMAGIDIEEFVAGFREMKARTETDDFWANPSMVHAAARFLAYKAGKKIEVLVTNSVALYNVCRFAEQLFPESEGHDGVGLWVAPGIYSEKLHANGQMVQAGERNIFEAFLCLLQPDNKIEIPVDSENLDGLNFLPENRRDMNFINQMVVEGPAYAHYKGGVPNIRINIPARNAFNIGQLYYMLERSVAISGYLLGLNPFVQPGVEAYKKAMFALAGKPGFEHERASILADIGKMDKIII